MASHGLAKEERLSGKERIGELFERGSVGKSRLFLVRALPNGLTYNRIAAISPKRAGKAVIRVRLRRRIRAAYRLQKQELPAGWDLALIARRGVFDAEFLELKEDMAKAISRATDFFEKATEVENG